MVKMILFILDVNKLQLNLMVLIYMNYTKLIKIFYMLMKNLKNIYVKLYSEEF